MRFLPVPSVEQSLERYLDYVRPLLSDDEFATTTAAVQEFGAGDGPACQEGLLADAERANEQGFSWLTEMWLEGYLTVRTSLPLSSNVGFEMTWPSSLRGTARAADLAHRFAQVHLQHLRGETEPTVSPRGEPLCMRQWTYLAGGLRRPEPGADEIMPGPEEAADREILVMHEGRGFAVKVSDAQGQVLPLATLIESLDALVAHEPDDAPDGIGFSAWSYLGSDLALPHQEAALADPHNDAVHERLTNTLFALALVEEKGELTDVLRHEVFDHGVLWPHKPVTYVVSLNGEHVGMHIEHTIADGGTLTAVVAAAQALPEGTPDVGTEDHEAEAASSTAPEQLIWSLDADAQARLTADIVRYQEAADRMRIQILQIPAVRPAAGLKVSHDAAQQFILQYAQLAAYGEVRSTYEAVDMREFQAGRTETMRPISSESVEFVTALLAGEANHAQLAAAADVHRSRIIRCKTGEGVDRHLLGLRVQAGRLGRTPAMFEDAGYRRLVTDFLSTSSLGGTAQIARFAFGPTSEGGIGVGYNPLVDEDGTVVEYDFVVNYRSDRDDDIEKFIAGIRQGAKALGDLVATPAS